MSDKNVRCVFCKQYFEIYEKVMNFTPATIKKCKMVLEYRQSKPVYRKSRLTYNNIELSEETSIYHAQCYKLFTAIKVPADFQQSEQQKSATNCDYAPEVSRESSESLVTIITTTTTNQASGSSTDKVGESSNFERDFCGENSDNHFDTNEPTSVDLLSPVKCLICDKSRKRLRGREVPLVVSRFQTIQLLKSTATEVNDIEMLEKINTVSDDNNITYHKCCKDQYLREISRQESEFTKKRKASNNAYTMLSEMVEMNVVKKKKCLCLDYVQNEYQKLLVEQSKLISDPISSCSISYRHLERKLMGTFKHKIKIIHAKKYKIIAPFTGNIHNLNDL